MSKERSGFVFHLSFKKNEVSHHHLLLYRRRRRRRRSNTNHKRRKLRKGKKRQGGNIIPVCSIHLYLLSITCILDLHTYTIKETIHIIH